MYTRWNKAPHWLRKTNKKAVMRRGNPSVLCGLRKWLYALFVRATCVGDSKDWSVTAATDGVIARVRPVREMYFYIWCSNSL